MEARFVERDGATFAVIEEPDRLAPFLMTVVSSSDGWMFLSSRGAVTAGRGGPGSALFPYVTEDKLHDRAGQSGPVTVVRLAGGACWCPWDPRGGEFRRVERELAKGVLQDEVVFTERCPELGLRWSSAWRASERYGWVRTVELENLGERAVTLEVLDGLLDLMPADAELGMQAGFSNLLDAYRMAEVLEGVGLGLVRLSSIPVDQPRPNESLRATTVFELGLDGGATHLSADAVAGFLGGGAPAGQGRARGQRGAFLRSATLELGPGETRRWRFALDVEADGADVVALAAELEDREALEERLDQDLARSRGHLWELVAAADGLQLTGSPAEDARHRANTLFNIMRGGVFAEGPWRGPRAFVDHVGRVAPRLAEDAAAAVEAFPGARDRAGLSAALRRRAEGAPPDERQRDLALARLADEFLPLGFSRRHGDPSRPWNTFRIPARGDDGSLGVGYEGNWRDIFQNWEALCASFPEAAPAAITRFLNASTADGYNPYRITLDGVDWEVHDPEDPWSFIGYWGDHQVVYLDRLVELAERTGGGLAPRLGDDGYVCVDVPYRIAGFDAVLANPWSTVSFDHGRAQALGEAVAAHGPGEGKLLRDGAGALVHMTLAEKLLTPLLVKLTNLVPEGGVWMNTQRPEWNDANNAIAGLGLSVVTTAHLHGALGRWRALFAAGPAELTLTRPLAALVERLAGLLAEAPSGSLTDAERGRWTEALGRAGEAHRAEVYRGASAGPRVTVPREKVLDLLEAARRWTEHTVTSNVRDDGLYHAYNLMRRLGGGGVGLRRLDLMLEGQVAVLASDLLPPHRALALLRALRASALYRADQRSYLLYPDRELAPFLERGLVPADRCAPGGAVARIVERGGLGVLRRAPDGSVRFAPAMRHRESLEAALNALGEQVPGADRAELLEVYGEVFDHEAFPGRSQTFFGYEGLGCIYWHMVSKLLLATQCAVRSADGETATELRAAYGELRAGLGTHKDPAEYGAFPTDPYSHTPGRGGARQPGLTGQVKEDFLARLGEFGIELENGRIGLRDDLLGFVEPLAEDGVLVYRRPDGERAELRVPAGAAACTYAGVPLVVRRGATDGPRLGVVWADGRQTAMDGRWLDEETSAAVFQRDGRVERLEFTAGA